MICENGLAVTSRQARIAELEVRIAEPEQR